MKHSQIRPVPKKSWSEQATEDLVFVAITIFLVYVITGLFKVLFWPLRYLFMTSGQIELEDLERAKQKIEQRGEYLKACREDPSDWIYQFRKNPENPEYMEWYILWRDGKLLDSKLRWAPDVYVDGKFNKEFLWYLQIQLNHHHRASWANKTCFRSTIRKYFPEVSPKFAEMQGDIEALLERVKIHEAEAELLNAIREFGLPKEISAKLVKEDISGTELREKALVIKRGIEKGFTPDAAKFVADKGLEPDSQEAELANLMISNSVPFPIIVSYFKGEINEDDVKELCEFGIEVIENFGGYLKDHRDQYEEVMDMQLNEVRNKRQEERINQKVGKAAWQK